MNSHYL